MTLDIQLMTMLVMTIGGVFVGFSLETYRRLSVIIQKRLTFVFLLESCFWLSQTAILFYLLYRVNEGQLRFYIFLACLLGYSIYVVLFKRLYQKLLEMIIITCKTIINWTIQAIYVLLIQPVIWLFKVAFILIKFILGFLLRLLSYPCKWLLSLAKWILPDIFFKKTSKFLALCSTIIDKLVIKVKQLWKKWRK